jgi:hypothetical protein
MAESRVGKGHQNSKSDLFAVFIEKCSQMTRKYCYTAMITQHAWMFLSSFEKMRAKLLLNDTVNMAHLGARAFEEIGGEVVQTTSFVLRKSHIPAYKGTYAHLIEPTTQQGKEDMFFSGENRYAAAQDGFSKIPGSPIAYSMSSKLICLFGSDKVSDYCVQRMRICTGDNNRFLRLWFEVNANNLFYPKKWVIFNKGGEYRRWFGNRDYVLDYDDNGYALKNSMGFSGGSDTYYFKPGIVRYFINCGFDLKIIPLI